MLSTAVAATVVALSYRHFLWHTGPSGRVLRGDGGIKPFYSIDTVTMPFGVCEWIISYNLGSCTLFATLPKPSNLHLLDRLQNAR